jgi:hypothetical protein
VSVGITIDKVYGVKVGALKSIEGKDGWINIYDYAAKMLDENIDKSLCSRLVSNNVVTTNRNSFGNSFNILKEAREQIGDKESSIYKFLETLSGIDGEADTLDYSLIGKLNRFSDFGINYEIKSNPSVDLNNLFNKVVEDFPLMRVVKRIGYEALSTEEATELIEYINSK